MSGMQLGIQPRGTLVGVTVLLWKLYILPRDAWIPLEGDDAYIFFGTSQNIYYSWNINTEESLPPEITNSETLVKESTVGIENRTEATPTRHKLQKRYSGGVQDG